MAAEDFSGVVYLPSQPMSADGQTSVDIADHNKQAQSGEFTDTYPAELIGAIDEFDVPAVLAEQTLAQISLSCNAVEHGVITTEKKVAVVELDGVFFPIVGNSLVIPWLPPDPGNAGRATIEGIDSDNDCVRDDVERYIVGLYPKSHDADKRKYLFEYAKWLGVFLKTSSYSTADVRDIYQKLITASFCANYNKSLGDVFAEFHNTTDRIKRAYGNSKKLNGWSPRGLNVTACP